MVLLLVMGVGGEKSRDLREMGFSCRYLFLRYEGSSRLNRTVRHRQIGKKVIFLCKRRRRVSEMAVRFVVCTTLAYVSIP